VSESSERSGPLDPIDEMGAAGGLELGDRLRAKRRRLRLRPAASTKIGPLQAEDGRSHDLPRRLHHLETGQEVRVGLCYLRQIKPPQRELEGALRAAEERFEGSASTA
jgi:hypothetical protein